MKNNTILNHCSSCDQCKESDLIELKSNVNYTYLYCNNCGYNKDISLRNMAIDSILFNIKNTLETLSHKLLLNSTIEIYKNDNLVNLFINNVKISTNEFEYSLSEHDCYYLKNTILYLIHDYTDTENININFYIN